MKISDIKLPTVKVEAVSDGFGKVKINTGEAVFYVKENILSPSEPGYPSPLELFLSGLVGCEAIMLQILARQLNIEDNLNVEITAKGSFEFQKGLVSLTLNYVFNGVSKEDAEALLVLVKEYCPVYATLRRAGIEISEEATVK